MTSQTMTSPRRSGHGRLGHFGLHGSSLHRTWGLLVSVVFFLLLIEFRLMWRKGNYSVGDIDSVSLQIGLREGYSKVGEDDSFLAGYSYRDADGPSPDGGRIGQSSRDSFKDKNGNKTGDVFRHRLIKSPSSELINRSVNAGRDGPGNEKGRGKDSAVSQKGGGSKNYSESQKGAVAAVGAGGRGEEKRRDGDVEEQNDVRRREVSGLDGAGGQDGEKRRTADVEKQNDVKSREVWGLDGAEELLLRYVQKRDEKPHEKWIVLDVTSGKCEENLSAPSGWKILVIGSESLPKGCKSPTCTVLRLDPSVTGQGREPAAPHALSKNLAYLTAISRGARFLLDADCSVLLSEAVNLLQGHPGKEHGLMYNETLLFNPYAHFGAWATGPRASQSAGGGKVREAGRDSNARLYHARDFDRVLVKHGVSDASPDLVVGARGGAASGTADGVRFSSSAPPVFLGQKSFSPAIPACSLYQRNAFWGLLLPCLSHSLHCHVLRQYVLQRLFRELDAFSGYYQLSRKAGQPAHGGASESSGAVDAEALASSLDAWRCKPSSKFFECFALLADYLHEKGHLDRHEASLMKSWVVALQKSGAAVQPARMSSTWRGVRKTSEVRVALGSTRTHLASGGAGEEQHLGKRLVDVAKARCSGLTNGVNWPPVARWGKPVIEDIVLIVVFNVNRYFWTNLPFLETMHRPFFKHIVYCVPNIDELLAGNDSEILRHVTLVEGLSEQWYLMYECVTTVAQMNFQGVRGNLQIGDDTLLNTWQVVKAPRDAMWIPQGFTTMHPDDTAHAWGWYWWLKSRGRPAVLQALADLEGISGMPLQKILQLDPNFNKTRSPKRRAATFSEIYAQEKAAFPPMRPMLAGSEAWKRPSREDAVKFLTNYYKVNRLVGLVKHRAMDMFYIPQALKEPFVKFSHHFMSHGVLIELAVPTLHFGLAPRSRVNYMRATSLWYEERDSAHSSFNQFSFFLHPFKISYLERKDSREFFCQVYLKTLFSKFSTET